LIFKIGLTVKSICVLLLGTSILREVANFDRFLEMVRWK